MNPVDEGQQQFFRSVKEAHRISSGISGHLRGAASTP
jgi:hypothetical protein